MTKCHRKSIRANLLRCLVKLDYPKVNFHMCTGLIYRLCLRVSSMSIEDSHWCRHLASNTKTQEGVDQAVINLLRWAALNRIRLSLPLTRMTIRTCLTLRSRWASLVPSSASTSLPSQWTMTIASSRRVLSKRRHQRSLAAKTQRWRV